MYNRIIKLTELQIDYGTKTCWSTLEISMGPVTITVKNVDIDPDDYERIRVAIDAADAAYEMVAAATGFTATLPDVCVEVESYG